MIRTLVALVLGLCLAACAADPSAPDPTHVASDTGVVWPTTGWPTSTANEQGLDAAVLESLDAEFAAGGHGYVDGMLVIRNGHVVFEREYTHDYEALFRVHGRDTNPGAYNYYDPDWHPYYQGGALHSMQSVTKSVTSALVGIAIGRGEIPAVHTAILPFFESYTSATPDPRRDAMTIEHVLTMTTGIRWDESSIPYTDPTNSCAGMERSDGWVEFVLDQPMDTNPGETWVYNSGATMLLSYLIAQTTGQQADDYAAATLFGPLGIDEYFWKRTPRGMANTEGGLYLTARDLAKFGYLYLRDGVWEDEGLLPEGWVEASTRPHVSTRGGTPGTLRYGYKWWLSPHPDRPDRYAYAARGLGGQLLIVVPEHDLIAVFTGWNLYETPSLNPQVALARVLDAVKVE